MGEKSLINYRGVRRIMHLVSHMPQLPFTSNFSVFACANTIDLSVKHT
jgi:hypothetical protein